MTTITGCRDRLRSLKESLRSTWEENHYFTLWFVPGNGQHVAKKNITKVHLKYVLMGAGALVVAVGATIGVLAHNASLNEETKLVLEEYKRSRVEQQETLAKLRQQSEENQKLMAELAALQEKVRKEMEKNGLNVPEPVKQEEFAGKGGGNMPQAVSEMDIVLKQQANIGLRAQAAKKDLANLLDELEWETYRREWIPRVWPTYGGWISSYFGGRANPFDGYSADWHSGIDIAADYGTPVYATASGYVRQAGWYGGYGRYVRISHDFGYTTCYAHMSSIEVSYGDFVEQGQIIGYVGSSGNSTGPHLHFELWRWGQEENPLNYI